MSMCALCYKQVLQECLPRNTVANRLYIAPVLPELSDLTVIEEAMIAQ